MSLGKEKETKEVKFKTIDSSTLRSLVQLLKAHDSDRTQCLKHIIYNKNNDQLQNFNLAWDFLEIKDQFVSSEAKSINWLHQLAINHFACEIKDAHSFVILFFCKIIIYSQGRTLDINFPQYETLHCCAIDGDTIYSGGRCGVIYVLNKKSSGSEKIVAHSDAIRSLVIEGNTLISCSSDETVKIWKKVSRELMRTIQHGSPVYCVMSTSDKIISGSYNYDLTFWDKNNGKRLNTVRYEGYPHSLIIDGDELLVAFYTVKGSVLALNKDSGAVNRVIVQGLEDMAVINSLFLQGNILFVKCRDGLRIYNKVTGDCFGKLKNSTDVGHIVGDIMVNNGYAYECDLTKMKIWNIQKYLEFCNFLKSELFLSEKLLLLDLEEVISLEKKRFLTQTTRILIENFLARLQEKWGDKIKEVVEVEVYKMYKEEPEECGVI